MDSLLASYASSDEEEEQQPIPSKTTSSSSSSLFSILPQPKSSSSSSLFNSLPPPKQSSSDTATNNTPSSIIPSISSLPKPNSQIQPPKPKRVVQFKPPIIPLPKPTEIEDEDEDDEEEQERIRRRKLQSSIQAPSVKSFLSSIPAPRNSSTLGVQSSSGSGRRSILETSTPAPALAQTSAHSAAAESDVAVDQNTGDYENYENYQYATDQHDSYGNYQYATHQYDSSGAGAGASTGTASNGDGYASYGAYEDYGQYENKWIDRSVPAEEVPEISESVLKFTGKRGRKDVPVEVIEVKQDELMKDRPREDKAKLTGLAFGPSYQPVSAKGKPSKLLKRKHQIGSLYFDMKQNEMKLAERRAKGMLTKAETQAKYGW
ncbi:proline-rich protein PRCC [Trifolium pratense]|uniref:Uncharacterized protein n=1 Tax=Trifolium pratense TaxID=57577 RepID=A0ACB0K204_TRIPR|nr:proline-rich protein PRCC [Trifolium pratense]CAJ2649825.1 unnamed protein product [Trifolium pratense]